jgi:hypothetical protein
MLQPEVDGGAAVDCTKFLTRKIANFVGSMTPDSVSAGTSVPLGILSYSSVHPEE